MPAGSQDSQHFGDERMADDVALAQPHHSDIRDRLEPPGDFGEPGKTVEEIALIGVAGDHHRRVPAQPPQ